MFLFAECFNDMLMRDQGFVIFKHLLALGETVTVATANNNNKRKLSTVDEAASSSTKKTRSTTTTNGTDDSTDTAAATESSSKQQQQHTKPQSQSIVLKPRTIHVDLLQAFTYFDTSRVGQMLERELEDLLLRFGPLNLTRSKLRPLIKKLPTIRAAAADTVSQQTLFNYRLLTDRTSSSQPAPLAYKLPGDEEIVHYALNFEAFLRRVQGIIGGGGGGSSGNNEDTVLVDFNGTAIDVASTLKRLEKAEGDLRSLDLKFKDSQEEIGKTCIYFISLKITKKRPIVGY